MEFPIEYMAELNMVADYVYHNHKFFYKDGNYYLSCMVGTINFKEIHPVYALGLRNLGRQIGNNRTASGHIVRNYFKSELQIEFQNSES